eukprot:548677-Amphidinium_carterae.1
MNDQIVGPTQKHKTSFCSWMLANLLSSPWLAALPLQLGWKVRSLRRLNTSLLDRYRVQAESGGDSSSAYPTWGLPTCLIRVIVRCVAGTLTESNCTLESPTDTPAHTTRTKSRSKNHCNNPKNTALEVIQIA